MTESIERMLPLYEAKMVAAYDHRAADVVRSASATKRQNQPHYLTDREHRNPARVPIPMSWVREAVVDIPPDRVAQLAFLRISSPTNHRTFIGSMIPSYGVGDSLFLLRGRSVADECLLLTQINSFVMDFVARQKVAGLNLSFFYVRQLPFLRPDELDTEAPWDVRLKLRDWLIPRALFLQVTSTELVPLAEATGHQSACHRWDPGNRLIVLSEIDAAMFHLFGVDHNDIDYIMETFPIVKRKDIAAHGEYRTKRLILEIYDEMAQAIADGTAYVSRFDPQEEER